MSSGAGELIVKSVMFTGFKMVVTFNNPLDFTTIDDASKFTVWVSNMDIVANLADPLIYDMDEYTITLTLTDHTWDSISATYGNTLRISIDASSVSDIRGNHMAADYISNIII